MRGEAGPRQEGFDAAQLAAGARQAGALVVRRPGKRIVSPLAGYGIDADQRLAVDHDAAAAAGADDDPEDEAAAARAPVDRLGQGKAVGVVHDPQGPVEALRQVPVERPAVEGGVVGVLHDARRGGDRSGDPESDAAAASRLGFGLRHEPGERHERRLVAVRRRDPTPQQNVALRVQDRGLQLGAADIDAHPQTRCHVEMHHPFVAGARSRSGQPESRLIIQRAGHARSALRTGGCASISCAPDWVGS